MTAHGFLVLAVIVLMIAALAKEVMRPGLVLFSALIILLIFGSINANEVLAGFSNKGMMTVGILFIVSEGIKQSGALNKLAIAFLPSKGKYQISVFSCHVSHFVHVSFFKQYAHCNYFCTNC